MPSTPSPAQPRRSTLGTTQLTLSTGTAQDLVIGGTAGTLTKLGLTAATTARSGGTTALGGLTLTIGATGNGTATSITFGDGTSGTVKSLNDLNAALAANNLQASVSSAGVITITTTNDAASSQIGTVGGTSAASGKAFNGAAGTVPVKDPAAQLVRSNLVAQYNNILDQITSTSQDLSFNGINLLNGDQLKLTFNETGTSTLTIQGVQFNAVGLSLTKLTAETDFLDNTSANTAITVARHRQQHAADRSIRAGFEPVDRADPSGLLEEPDQRAADRLVEPDAGRHQRGSGQQPGAVHPPVDRGVRAGAGQPVPAERAPAPALSLDYKFNDQGGGGNPAAFLVLAAGRSREDLIEELRESILVRKSLIDVA